MRCQSVEPWGLGLKEQFHISWLEESCAADTVLCLDPVTLTSETKIANTENEKQQCSQDPTTQREPLMNLSVLLQCMGGDNIHGDILQAMQFKPFLCPERLKRFFLRWGVGEIGSCLEKTAWCSGELWGGGRSEEREGEKRKMLGGFSVVLGTLGYLDILRKTRVRKEGMLTQQLLGYSQREPERVLSAGFRDFTMLLSGFPWLQDPLDIRNSCTSRVPD